MRTQTTLLLTAVGAFSLLAGSLLADEKEWAQKEWPMWGGSPGRNMVSPMKGLPATWDYAKKENIRWIAALGSQSYGNPVVADGVVLVGTNNEGLRDPKQPGDRGVLMAFRESDGEFLWQITHDKLAAGRVNDWPYQGVCSSPSLKTALSTTSPTVANSSRPTSKAWPTATMASRTKSSPDLKTATSSGATT